MDSLTGSLLPPEGDRYGGIIAGTEHGRWRQQPQRWVCR